MSNNRKYIRHPAEIPIEFATADLDGKAQGQAHNVSLGGLAFDSQWCPREGELLDIRIPTVEPEFSAPGRVAWCRRRAEGFEVGVQFVDASDAFRARMVEQVCHIENYRNEVREREGRDLNGDAAAQEWIRKYAADFPDPRADRDL